LYLTQSSIMEAMSLYELCFQRLLS
jgi:hypothetical protein